MDLSNQKMIHVKKDGIEYLQFRKLLEFDNLVNCYTLSTKDIDFTRKTDSDINKEKVEHSYNMICDALNINVNNVVRPFQTHSDIIKSVENIGNEYKSVDGLITNKNNIDLMLTFADCTPILIYDPVKKVIGNIHSGWRGTVQKIGQKAILQMAKEYGCDIKDLIVCIGPCIGKCHFEVRDDVRDIFYNTFSYLNRNEDIIKSKDNEKGKYLIDTTLINRLILEEVGIKPNNIYESGICTVCNSNLIHSYRANGKEAGRNIAILGMK